MTAKANGAFVTRPGIAACDVAGGPRAGGEFADAQDVADLLRQRGMADETAQAKAALFVRCVRALPEAAGRPTHALFVPGRIELLGKHTDYCGGRSLLCTVERGFCLVVTPRDDAEVRLRDVATGEQAAFPLSADLVPTAGHWTNYAMTVARRVAANFGTESKLRGCDIAFISDLPQAAGLSSSSAFVVATFMALSAVNGLPAMAAYRENIRSTEDLANYLGCCENGSTFGILVGTAGVGTFGGSQDHTAILCCKPDTLSMFSFCPVRREADVPLPAGVSLHVCPSGVVAEKTGSAMAKYNAVSRRARKIVELWNAATGQHQTCLNGVVSSDSAALPRLRTLLADHAAVDAELSLTARLDQFLIESNRLIPAAARLLAAGTLEPLGALVDESQALSEANLMNQVPETIALQRQMRQAGAIAASAFGAGFGGSVWGMFATAERR